MQESCLGVQEALMTLPETLALETNGCVRACVRACVRRK
jgi:hypothetical protein